MSALRVLFSHKETHLQSTFTLERICPGTRVINFLSFMIEKLRQLMLQPMFKEKCIIKLRYYKIVTNYFA